MSTSSDYASLTTTAPAEPDQQLAAGLGSAGMLLGGVGFLYGAVTSTQTYGPAPWALLAAYIAGTCLVAITVQLLRRSANAAARPRRAARIGGAVADRLSFAGPEAAVVLALAVPWIAFAGYGLIRLVQG